MITSNYRVKLTARLPQYVSDRSARMNLFSLPQLARKARERRRIFSAIHATRAWGVSESASGPGSTRERAATFLPDLVALIQSLRIHTLLDAPCGDFNWAAPVADSVSRYVGVDIVPALIAANRRHWSSPRRQFLCRDMCLDGLPAADLILCRDALVHLSERDIFAALDNLRRTGAEYLLATTFVGERDNRNIDTGGWRPLNMQSSPFSFPAPAALIDERCSHTGGAYADKRLGLWRFEALPVIRPAA